MKIAILGFGTVGSGVYEIAKTLKNIEVKKVLEKDLSKIDIATDNYDEIILNDDIFIDADEKFNEDFYKDDTLFY